MSIKLEKFEVKTWSQSGQQYDQMYANGRQQCQIEIDILKLMWNDTTSEWDYLPLSDAEKTNLELVPWSDNTSSELPTNWDCDSNRNSYDLGLETQTALVSPLQTTRSIDLELPVTNTCKLSDIAPIEPIGDSQPQVLMRYIRAAETGTQKLMARIKLDDGSVVTTNINLEYGSFDSYVMVTSITVPPMVADDLIVNTQDAPLTSSPKDGDVKSGDPLIDVDLYYYKLPRNLTIYNLSHTYDIGNYAYFYYKTYKPFMTDRNITYALVYPLGTSSGSSIGGECHTAQYFSVDPSHSHFVAMRGNEDECKWVGDPPSGNANVNVIDNYGCDHHFVLYPQGDSSNAGNTIGIRDPY